MFTYGKKRWTKSEMVFVQNGMTSNLGRIFFLIVKFLDKNCNEKLQQPIRGKNTQMIAYWYKPHIQRKGEKTKKRFVHL
jgi:hypothetical protein